MQICNFALQIFCSTVVVLQSSARESFSPGEFFYHWEKTGRFAAAIEKNTFRRLAEVGHSY